MLVRRATNGDLGALLELYRFLHSDDPVLNACDSAVSRHWLQILSDAKLRYYVAEEAGRPVATCTLALIPNLTRGLRPYGVVENVVTHPEFRRRGLGRTVLRLALEEAWAAGCYKVMLETGSRAEATLRFYEQAGFARGIKTGFVAYPPQSAPEQERLLQ